MSYSPSAQLILAELREFAGFSPCEQRYIRRSLDVGLGRGDAFRLWARNGEETASIRAQYVVYQDLKLVRRALETSDGGEGLDAIEVLMGPMLRVSTFDLAQERLGGFCAYRFLYERLLGAAIRPWLPGRRSAARRRCRRSAPNGARACSSRSARLRRPLPAGRCANRRSFPNSSNSKRLEIGERAGAAFTPDKAHQCARHSVRGSCVGEFSSTGSVPRCRWQTVHRQGRTGALSRPLTPLH